MMMSTIFFVVMSLIAAVLGGEHEFYGSALEQADGYDFQGFHGGDAYSHLSHYAHSPAYSTVSYVMSTGHKPVTYSGFTNHGSGHHDPGFSVQFRSEGQLHGEKDHYY